MSIYNEIARRGHCPREEGIRRLMEARGFVFEDEDSGEATDAEEEADAAAAAESADEEGENEEELEEGHEVAGESGESEAETDDDVVDPPHVEDPASRD